MNWPSESKAAKRDRLTQWHKWFAWVPVRIGERMYWLETVDRKLFERVGTSYDGEQIEYYKSLYRAIGK